VSSTTVEADEPLSHALSLLQAAGGSYLKKSLVNRSTEGLSSRFAVVVLVASTLAASRRTLLRREQSAQQCNRTSRLEAETCRLGAVNVISNLHANRSSARSTSGIAHHDRELARDSTGASAPR
jgi:hypothetical protein